MPTTQRSKAPWRLAIIMARGLTTAGFLGAVVNGPQPIQSSQAIQQVIVQQVPTLDQTLNQSQAVTVAESDATNNSASSAGTASAVQPRLRTGGS